ncbi:MAG: hypothetical protein ACJ76S_03905 [Solirubrobacteraceae bacterium]
MAEETEHDAPPDQTGGETADQEQGSGVSLPDEACRTLPLRVGVQATDEILAVLSTAGMNALPDPGGESPQRVIVEVDADSPEEAIQKIRDLLGDVSVEAAD